MTIQESRRATRAWEQDAFVQIWQPWISSYLTNYQAWLYQWMQRGASSVTVQLCGMFTTTQ